MSSLNDLNNEVHRIRILIEQNNVKMKRIKSMKNTTAKQGIYYNGKVVINDKLYKCSLASKDIILKNGVLVYCLPTLSGVAIIGGGI